MKGNYPGVARNAPGDNDNMAAAEFIYGGGFKGPVCGNTVINLGNGRVFNTFAGACDADILGHTATYMGRNTNDDTDRGFPMFVTMSMVVTTSVEESWVQQTSAGA